MHTSSFSLFLFALLCLSYSFQCSTVQFNVVLPQSSKFKEIVVLVRINSSVAGSYSMTNSNNITHSYTFETSSNPINEVFEYQYEVEYTSETVNEGFWRQLTPDRLRSDSQPSAGIYITKNEYFGQYENYIGLDPVPHFVSNIPPPEYFDDNQMMTVNFQISTTDLDAIIFNPNDRGETYVKANMSFISLEKNEYYQNMKIRRAGGVSLVLYPYSYQIKIELENNQSEKVDLVIKFKSYASDYTSGSAKIISEKTSSDICMSVGAPINYVSFVRLFINGENQGFYGMLEKVDNQFIERRWPYLHTSHSVGSLYKTQSAHWYLLTNSGWQGGIAEYCKAQGDSAPYCCPCYENNCNVDSDCNKFDDDDEVCQTLSCCQCTWETNGSVDIESANCQTQQPFDDFIQLGNSVLSENSSQISSILNGKGYVQSLICALAVMNADGYVFNGKNYYWYRDSVSGQFNLILYDQDTCFTRNSYVSQQWSPWNWTFEGNLADALFLPTLLQDPAIYQHYNSLLSEFLSGFYRPDRTGPLYQRMEQMANFIATYNPDRKQIQYKTNGFIDWFILPLSSLLSSQLEDLTIN